MEPERFDQQAGYEGARPPNRFRQLALTALPILALLVVAIIAVVVFRGPASPATAVITSPPAPREPSSSGSTASQTVMSASPDTSPSASPFRPSAAPTESHVGTDRLIIKWINPPGASGLEGLTDIRGYASQGGHYVIVGSRDVPVDPDQGTSSEVAIWWSDDATSWHLATFPAGYGLEGRGCCMWDVVAAGPGFVATGEGLPLWSTDGATWTQGTGDELPDEVAHWGRVSELGASELGVVAFGIDYIEDGESSEYRPIARQSVDGMHWTDAQAMADLFGTDDAHLVPAGDELFAFVSRSDSKTVVYRMTSLGAWQERASIDDYDLKAVYGPNGWLAIGAENAWLSPHGVNWTYAGPAPYPYALIADSAGYIVGSVVGPPEPGCVVDLSDSTGETWTSIDGVYWRKMKAEWKGRWLNAFFIIGRSVVGVGQAHDDGEFGFVRTADLPDEPPTAGPTPTATPLPTAMPTPGEGCGG